jgi:catechol 2,3-dioxygenase-like lactoylglutathione lyase family enzyme
MLERNEAVARTLLAAGATTPRSADVSDFRARMAKLGTSVRRGTPAIDVADIAKSLDWYSSIGFTEVGRHEEDELVNWGMVSFGAAMLAFGLASPPESAVSREAPRRRDVSLWFETDEIEALYELLRSRQLENAMAAMAGEAASQTGVVFEEQPYRPFYGGQQFSIRDPDGYALIFLQLDRE